MIGLRDLASAACRDDRRRAVILAHPTVNGIDFVEYEHRGTAAPVEEVKTCFAFAKRVLA